MGFLNLQGMFDQRVSSVNIDLINTAIQQSVDEHNRQVAAVMSLFVAKNPRFNQSPTVRFKTPVAVRNQPLDENGRARPIRVAGHYDVAFPLQGSGNAWGANFVAREKMTVEDANNITATLIDGDTRWMRDHVLAGLFTNVSWTYTDDDDDVGSLTIKGPANGNTDTYLVQGGADAGATDTHFLAQSDAIATAHNPFPTMYQELMEHPENGGEAVCFVPTSNKAAVEGVSGFVVARRPNDPVQPGSSTDVLVGDLPASVPGKLFGYLNDTWMVHWPTLPTDYLIEVATQGERALGMREHPEASLQGFKRVAERNDHPFMEAQYLRFAGFGAWNRVGVVVQRVGNGSYAIPTNFTSPMP
jgi:hypothetical protein